MSLNLPISNQSPPPTSMGPHVTQTNGWTHTQTNHIMFKGSTHGNHTAKPSHQGGPAGSETPLAAQYGFKDRSSTDRSSFAVAYLKPLKRLQQPFHVGKR